MSKLPVVFVGHGSPMNSIEENIFTKTWKAIGESLPRPRAILMLSAHWITEWETRINTSETPEMIYDMYGFPDELYRIKYATPGSISIAEEIIHHLWEDFPIIEDNRHWLDHGAWSTLIHLFPEAYIPVIQMSLDYAKPLAWHFAFWKKLAGLRDQWILIIGSGNIVHNLRMIDWTGKNTYSWAQEFDTRVAQWIESKAYDDILDFESWGEIALLAQPSYDHFLPLIPLLGTVDTTDTVEFFTEDIVMGNLSMRSMVWR